MTRNAAYLLESEAAHKGTVYFPLFFAVPLALCVVATLALAISGFGAGAHEASAPFAMAVAYADDEEPLSDAKLTALELQQKIEAAQADYSAIREEMDGLQAAIDENRERIGELEEQIPAQQERGERAARELYKLQQDGVGLVDLLLNAGSLDDFLTSFEYVNYLTDANMREIERLAALRDEVDGERAQLEESYAEASARASEAEATLAGLQEAQAEVQRRIEEEARIAAEAAAKAAEQAEHPRDNDKETADKKPDSAKSDEADSSEGKEGESAAEEEPEAEAEPESESEPEPAPEPEPEPEPAAPEPASDEEAFVAEWTARIDAYLAGSPLAGQGATFARAAYTYGVDPRWSPAISFTESGKGAACFLPHNAWGWGSESWGSWEEAINDHVAGLSRGYGYTISLDAARKYCPPNAQAWYDRTKGQMDLI